MKYLDIPLVVLVVAALYLCGVYVGLGLLKRLAMSRAAAKSLDATKTVRHS